MDIYIDNQHITDYFNITVLNYTQAFSIASEREDQRVWNDKSGVEKNLANIKYDAKEFVFECYCKASNIATAYEIANILVAYMYNKGVFVLSLRDDSKNIRECFLCERSTAISPIIQIRQVNSLYQFKLGLKDINPNAVKYKTEIIGNEVTIIYTKGQTADIYWGDGDRGLVSNSSDYTKDDYASDGLVDIIVDVDADNPDITPLVADFEADVTSGARPLEVNFTDLSTGDIVIWSWNFGDGNTSDEQSPTHVYEVPGLYTVSLQIFNAAQGTSANIKENYISVRDALLLINDSGDSFLINTTDKLRKN